MTRIGISQIIIVNASFSGGENNCLAYLSPLSTNERQYFSKAPQTGLKHGYFTEDSGSDERKEKIVVKYKENALSLPTHSN